MTDDAWCIAAVCMMAVSVQHRTDAVFSVRSRISGKNFIRESLDGRDLITKNNNAKDLRKFFSFH